ncbi:hypothetical protein ACEWY4_018564 [Coilia grayii]|uniref:TBC1 domain-containing protein n=1 Tax=Coilia grayii TaxID=363190 RepID=A0ABD1JDU1_9TELE
MLSCCCSDLTCQWRHMIRTDELQQKTVGGCQLYTEDGTQSPESVRMDIALLKEQYNCIKEKQRQETRVVVFKKASSYEEAVEQSPVTVVPMRQEVKRAPLKRQLSEVHSDIFQNHSGSVWRTHLGLHRKGCCAVNGVGGALYSNQVLPTTPSTLLRDSSLESTGSSEKLASDCEESEGPVGIGSSSIRGQEEGSSSIRGQREEGDSSTRGQTEEGDSSTRGQTEEGSSSTRGQTEEGDSSTRVQEEGSSSCPRKGAGSARPVLRRQWSLCSHRPSQPPPPTVCYYPFPQLKCPRKSEAARRLGMYSSF